MRSSELLVVANVWTVGAIAAQSGLGTVLCVFAALMFFALSWMTE